MRILVIGPSWIGDMVMSQSLYRTLKLRYPQAIIDVVAPPWCYPLLSYMPEVNESIQISISHGSLSIHTRYILGRSLRKRFYDRAYILPNSFKSALIPFFAKIPYRIGWYGEMRYGILNDIRSLDEMAWPLMVERYVALAYDKETMHSAKDLPQPILRPRLRVKNNRSKLSIFSSFSISFTYPVIGLCPGAEFGQIKCWPHHYYAELAKKLINEGYQIILLGSIKDHEIGSKIMSILGKDQQACCRNLIGETKLEQAIILISACTAIVSNDSGLMHVAAALDRPLLALYGTSSPYFTPPLSCKARIIHSIYSYNKVHKRNNIEEYHQSLIDIKPQLVLEELNKLLLREKNI